MVDLERLRAMRVIDFDNGILPCPISIAAADELAALRARVERLRDALGWIADPSHDLGQEDTASFFRDMAVKALRADTSAGGGQ